MQSKNKIPLYIALPGIVVLGLNILINFLITFFVTGDWHNLQNLMMLSLVGAKMIVPLPSDPTQTSYEVINPYSFWFNYASFLFFSSAIIYRVLRLDLPPEVETVG